MLLRLVVVCCVVCVSQAWWWKKKQPEWNNLKVTFGANVFSSRVFADLPRTVDEARRKGWIMIDRCRNDGPFRGARYVKQNDFSVTLLYDVNGYIAGIQCGLLKGGLPHDFPPLPLRNVFQEDGNDRVALTAYFTDPAIICTTGRTSSTFQEEGTGSNLYIQTGSDPLTQSSLIPRQEKDIAKTPWKRGRCFVGMGVHYWFNVTQNMSCDNFFPAFLLYNDGKLNAFGWALGIPQTSSRFEHPSRSSLSWFFDPVPSCLSQQPDLSTMHIYLTSNPVLNVC
ncbi:uncharacterized protein LOC112564143 [Pomacea canaliculata]|uniref:uncharacterized protein LOC112564143 n=1 Tax=Pomacea canaliculata TaxID=400727 RepID=UPI000D73B888|nr:uncharacterized protein LOC112564143 [Pomacea canaliculata]